MSDLRDQPDEPPAETEIPAGRTSPAGEIPDLRERIINAPTAPVPGATGKHIIVSAAELLAVLDEQAAEIKRLAEYGLKHRDQRDHLKAAIERVRAVHYLTEWVSLSDVCHSHHWFRTVGPTAENIAVADVCPDCRPRRYMDCVCADDECPVLAALDQPHGDPVSDHHDHEPCPGCETCDLATQLADARTELTQLDSERDQLKATLAEVLAVFFTVMSDQTGEVLGYLAPAASIHPDDFARWQAVLDQPTETTAENSCGCAEGDQTYADLNDEYLKAEAALDRVRGLLEPSPAGALYARWSADGPVEIIDARRLRTALSGDPQ